MDNLSVFLFIFHLSGINPLLDGLMIFGAEFLIFLTIGFMILLGIRGKKDERSSFVIAILAIVIALILIQVIRLFWIEPRPFVTNHVTPLIKLDPDASFPSVHTTIMAAMAWSFWFMKSRYRVWFMIALFWVGFSRIFVGVHYPLDILAGFVVGLVSAALGKESLRWMKEKSVL